MVVTSGALTDLVQDFQAIHVRQPQIQHQGIVSGGVDGRDGLFAGGQGIHRKTDLGKMARGSNSFEISLSFIGRRSAKTPEVDFVCPRL